MAVLLMCEAKKGFSANQMMRSLGIAKKTAWYLCHRIRNAMAEVNARRLTGTVEVDETYVGGKRRGMGRGYVGNKAMVVGAVQRGGKIRMKVEERDDKATLQGTIEGPCVSDLSNSTSSGRLSSEHPKYRKWFPSASNRNRYSPCFHQSRNRVVSNVDADSATGCCALSFFQR